MGIKVRAFRSGGWEADINVRMPDGSFYRERRKAPGMSKLDASRWAREREAHLIRNGRPQPQTKEAPSLENFSKRFIEEHGKANRQKPSTISSKESIFKHHLIPHLGSRRLDEIRETDVQSLKGALADYAPKTVNNVLTVLNKMLRVAAKWGVIDRVPVSVELVKAPAKQMAFYVEEDFERLLVASRTVDPRCELVVLLAGDAGLRAGEIIALEQNDVDWSRCTATVQRSEWRKHVTTPKGGRSRRVPLTRRCFAALQANRHLRGARVLYQDDGRPVEAWSLRVWLERAQAAAGLRSTGAIHILRHTFCSRLATLGAPARAIQELAGHADLATTMRYMHLSPGAKESAVGLLDARVQDRDGDVPETTKAPR